MAEKKETATDQTAASADLQKMMFEFLGSLYKPWTELFNPPDTKDPLQPKGRVTVSLQAVRKWQNMVKAISEPSTLEHLYKATETTPNIALELTETCLQSLTGLQVKAGEWIKKRGAALSSSDIRKLDRDLIKNLTDTYHKEFSRFFKIPQIGLHRFHQERMLHAVDKQNNLQLMLSEFLHMLYMPIEKSLDSLLEKITEMNKAGLCSENSKTYYKLWIKLLEGHYMELFKKAEYSEVMARTLTALTDFSEARQKVVNDLLKQMNIPTNLDIDELSKEIYLLKKRIRLIEKEQQDY